MSDYDIIEELNKKQMGMVMFLPIHSIDGVVCQGNLSLRNVAKSPMVNPEDTEKRVKLEIVAQYRFRELHVTMFKADATHQDIIDYIKSIANFKFCRLSSKLLRNETDWKPHYQHKFMQELFTEIANDNLRTDFGDCPVCLETCYTKLVCGHHLCLQCESKMTECKCPQCRAAYSRDIEDEEVY
jgi:hypothetical protein